MLPNYRKLKVTPSKHGFSFDGPQNFVCPVKNYSPQNFDVPRGPSKMMVPKTLTVPGDRQLFVSFLTKCVILCVYGR